MAENQSNQSEKEASLPAVAKDPGRVAIVEKIALFEKEGRWQEDVEDDPPTIPLTPDKVDYLNKKLSSKFWMKFANILARRHINRLIKK